MPAGLEPLVVFWSGRGIHITVLLSFAVQVTLLLLADLRRRADWPVLRVIIWSAYMLADTTAIYALGHLSVVVRLPEHHLMSAGHATQTDEVDLEGLSAGPANHTDEMDIAARMLVIAYSLLDVPKQMFEGPTRFVKIKKARPYEGKFMLEVVQMLLTMMYDLLYTKAAVVHTWYGFFVRVISLPFTVAALRLFHALSDKDGYTRSDVLVTKVLLTGAVVLQTISVLRAVFSMWTAALLYERKWYRLGCVVQCVELVLVIWPMMILVQSEDYWSGHMRQHSLFEVFHQTVHSKGSRIAKRMGREDLWDSTFYSWPTCVPGAIIDKVLGLVSTTTEDGQSDITESRGRNALRRDSRYLGLGEDLVWSVGLDLDESILVWHIATHVYIWWYRYRKNLYRVTKVAGAWDLLEATQAVCNYMFLLLAARPYMLPYPVTRQRYVQLCHDSITHLRSCDAHNLLGAILDQKEALMEGSPLKPDGVRGIIGVSPNRRSAQPSVNSTGDGGTSQPPINTTLDRACQLAAKLLHTVDGADVEDALDTLKMIFEVWVEMLCYTAYWCNEKSHAKNLTNGGELMTIVALMMVYTSNGFINVKDRGAAGSSLA